MGLLRSHIAGHDAQESLAIDHELPRLVLSRIAAQGSGRHFWGPRFTGHLPGRWRNTLSASQLWHLRGERAIYQKAHRRISGCDPTRYTLNPASFLLILVIYAPSRKAPPLHQGPPGGHTAGALPSGSKTVDLAVVHLHGLEDTSLHVGLSEK